MGSRARSSQCSQVMGRGAPRQNELCLPLEFVAAPLLARYPTGHSSSEGPTWIFSLYPHMRSPFQAQNKAWLLSLNPAAQNPSWQNGDRGAGTVPAEHGSPVPSHRCAAHRRLQHPGIWGQQDV